MAAFKRLNVLARLPLCLDLLLLLCPGELRRNLAVIPGAYAAGVVLALWSAVTVISSLVFAFSKNAAPAIWLRAFAIESAVGAAAIRAEIGLAWFALTRWRASPSDVPADAAAFKCSAGGTDVAMAWVAAASGLVEAPILHLVLRHVSVPAAWAATWLALLMSMYFAGFAKSLVLRPILLFDDRLLIRLGVVLSQNVRRAEIEDVRVLAGGDVPRAHARFYAFDSPNVAVRAGGRTYVFRVDEPKRLLAALRAA